MLTPVVTEIARIDPSHGTGEAAKLSMLEMSMMPHDQRPAAFTEAIRAEAQRLRTQPDPAL